MERQSAEQYGCLFRHTCLGSGRRRNRQGGFRTVRAASAAEEAVSGAAGNRTYTGARRGHARRGSHRLPVGSWVGETDAGLHSAAGGDGSLLRGYDAGGAGRLCRYDRQRGRHRDA